MKRFSVVLRQGIRRTLERADGLANRLYGSRLNPLHQSGALAIALLAVLLVTGLYLLIFYRIGSPYASVARMTEQVWLGRWIRGLHRYASAAALVAVGVHALRMFAQGRSWGPRVLAWTSGVVLVFVLLVCGWTGYVMVWDVQGQVLAMEGARLLDVLPLFSEPISRTFVGDRPLPSAFFFVNLFLHSALPIGLGLILWLHVARVARPTLLPPRGLLWGVIGLLLAVALLWPVGMAPEADLFAVPGRAPFDWFYSFWIPLTHGLPAGAVWALFTVVALTALMTPLWSRPPAERRPQPSIVDERYCTGCEQCVLDCPYQSIALVERTDGRDTLVARVNAELCVSCGICAGSCAPMGVGPPGRTGRDQLAEIRAFIAERQPGAGDVVLVACKQGAGGLASSDSFDGAMVLPVNCAGNLHTSVVELLVRSGAAGVLVVSCNERDCWNREGPKWLHARMYEGREAELKDRVDRMRVRIAYAGAAERAAVLAELARFREALRPLHPEHEEVIDLVQECERPQELVEP